MNLPPRLDAPLLYAVGLGSGVANRLLHPFLTYKPADYAADNIERGVSHVREICDRWQQALQAAAPDETFAGKRILELGPGHSLGTGLVLLARGAASYTAVDVFPLVYRSPAALYTALARAEGATPDLVKEARFHLVEFPSLRPLDESFDVVVSNSTMEHVEDVPSTMRALRARVSGFMVHHIDAQVHLRVREIDPLNHLRFGERTYQLMYFAGEPNRLLAEDYRSVALQAGFTDAKVLPGRVASADYLARVNSKLAPRFRGRRDLQYLSFTLFAR